MIANKSIAFPPLFNFQIVVFPMAHRNGSLIRWRRYCGDFALKIILIASCVRTTFYTFLGE